MTLRLVRPLAPLSDRPINPATFCLRAFCASIRFARRHPAMAETYYRSAYGFLAERVRLEGAR